MTNADRHPVTNPDPDPRRDVYARGWADCACAPDSKQHPGFYQMGLLYLDAHPDRLPQQPAHYDCTRHGADADCTCPVQQADPGSETLRDKEDARLAAHGPWLTAVNRRAAEAAQRDRDAHLDTTKES